MSNYNAAVVEEIGIEALAGAESYAELDDDEDRVIVGMLAHLRRRFHGNADLNDWLDTFERRWRRADARADRAVLTLAAETHERAERLAGRLALQKKTAPVLETRGAALVG